MREEEEYFAVRELNRAKISGPQKVTIGFWKNLHLPTDKQI